MMKCTMYAYSTSPHVSQLYTGFSLLRMNGEISLKQTLVNYCHKGREMMKHLEPQALNGLFVTLNDEKVLFYDTSDGPSLNDDALEIADAYFKRSYLYTAIPDFFRSRVFPLGLNYEVYTGKLDHHEFARTFFRKNLISGRPVELMRSIAKFASISFLPTTLNMYSLPKPDHEPRVLFMARAWDPDGELPGSSLPLEQKHQRACLNETRARCIKLLRKELGPYFYGGFDQSHYAKEKFKDLLLDNSSISSKKNYISLLHQHPICIATTGLHGSIGWKMGEYVAFSKCIVSEKLNFTVPGNFAKDRNFFEFDTPELCLQKVMELVGDRFARRQMMEANWLYYTTHLRPERLVANTLILANEMSPRTPTNSASREIGAVPITWA